jgi:hypothetical protein
LDAEEDEIGRPERERIALFRYRLIAEALNPRAATATAGRLVREIASREHEFTDGRLDTSTGCPANRGE